MKGIKTSPWNSFVQSFQFSAQHALAKTITFGRPERTTTVIFYPRDCRSSSPRKRKVRRYRPPPTRVNTNNTETKVKRASKWLFD